MWDKLSMQQKADYIKLAVQNGVTSLSSIREVYNSYAKGGIVNKLADGGETGLSSLIPWDWFYTEYETPTLKEAIEAAYNDDKKGETIVWNGSRYKALLNEQDEATYKGKRFTRVRPNDSRTQESSTNMENNIINRQKSMHKAAQQKGYDSSSYFIPYIYDKEIKIPGVGRVSSNFLDSIAVNAQRAGVPLEEAIGLAIAETKLGAIPNYSIKAVKDAYREKYERDMTKEQVQATERKAHNSSVARNFGGIYPQFLVNDHEWFQRGWQDSPRYRERLESIKSPLEHAFTLYKLGLYNTGSSAHSGEVKKAGKDAMKTRVVKDWYKEYRKNQ